MIYCQPYNPHASKDEDKPFILVIQDDWMLEMAKRFSKNNSWAIDSTFKTNIYGLPLYAAVLPNQQGVGLPIWFMLCTVDLGCHHDVIALQLTLKIVFERMGDIRPSAIVIDKSQQELDAILNVVNEDSNSWTILEDGTRHQTSCRVLLCWFHIKKAWVENLLPQVLRKRENCHLQNT